MVRDKDFQFMVKKNHSFLIIYYLFNARAYFIEDTKKIKMTHVYSKKNFGKMVR